MKAICNKCRIYRQIPILQLQGLCGLCAQRNKQREANNGQAKQGSSRAFKKFVDRRIPDSTGERF